MKRKLISNGYHMPYNPELTKHAKRMKWHPTPAEKKLWDEYLCNFPFRVQRQKPLDNYIADFYIAKLKLVIEVDGKHHQQKGQKNYDANRTGELESYGIKVLRFTNEQILKDFDSVIKMIED